MIGRIYVIKTKTQKIILIAIDKDDRNNTESSSSYDQIDDNNNDDIEELGTIDDNNNDFYRMISDRIS